MDNWIFKFGPVGFTRADIELTLRISGHVFCVQVAQPGGLFPAVQDALAGSVPVEVMRAAVAYAIRSLWAAFEKWTDNDIELLDIELPTRTWTADEGVGVRVSGSTEDGSGALTAMICAADPAAWNFLNGVPSCRHLPRKN